MNKLIVRIAWVELAAVFGFGFMLGKCIEASKYEVSTDTPIEAKKKSRAIKIEDGKVIFDIASWR